MMKRLFSSNSLLLSALAVCVSFVGAAMVLNGCQPPSVGYQVQQYAQIRVMNFAPNCTVPMDVYWDAAGQTTDSLPKVNNLAFGQASVYFTSISAASSGTVYHLVARPVRDKSKSLRTQDVTIMPGKKYTWIVALAQDNSGNFISQLITDDSVMQQSSTNNTFVRFVNMMPNSGNLSLYVNDPTNGDQVTPAGGVAFNSVSPYVALKTSTDTNYTLFVTPGDGHSLVARLAFQTFASGNYYTAIYSGDLCRTPAQNPGDTLNDKSDTIRIRVFDDNVAGNELTNPPPRSFRYNIVNAYVPWSNTYGAGNDRIGFLLNGEGFPSHANFTVSPIPLYQPGGSYVWLDPSQSDTVWNVAYQSGSIPTPVDLKAFGTTASGGSLHPLFDINPTVLGGFQTDKPATFLIYDTVVPPPPGVTTLVKYVALALPDTSSPDAAIVEFISGIPTTSGVTTLNTYSSFWITSSAWSQGADSETTLLNANGGALGGRGQIMSFPVPAGSSIPLTIIDSIGSPKGNLGRIGGPSKTFNAHAGGIYEVILTGVRSTDPQKTDPHLMILRVNP